MCVCGRRLDGCAVVGLQHNISDPKLRDMWYKAYDTEILGLIQNGTLKPMRRPAKVRVDSELYRTGGERGFASRVPRPHPPPWRLVFFKPADLGPSFSASRRPPMRSRGSPTGRASC